MKFLKWLGFILLLLIVVYFLGPQPPSPKFTKELPAVPAEPVELEKYISSHEALHKLKPDNEARIIWLNDSLKEKTEYSVVYIHGFSACQEEGDPVHTDFAKKFGCNLFLNRLEDYGIPLKKPLPSENN
jgi:hypothetical protein